MFSPTKSVEAIAAMLFLCIASVNAHMKMITPMPYGASTLDNSPLLATGADFPCKQRSGVYDFENAVNNMVIGEPQTLSFEGSAVHGGGSCQVSLTTDLQPTANTQWMVIHSIQGGCPSNVTGNLPDDAAGNGAATFQYTIPQGITPGQYTIAWSWVNKIGNREFYMNCGPANITAAAKKRYAPAPPVSKRQTSFPAMFVANLVSVNNCSTIETQDTVYPDPGSSYVNGTIGTNLQPPPPCNGAVAASPGTPSATVAPPAGSSAPTSSGSAPSAASSAPASFATGSATAAPAATSTAVVSPIPAASSVASAGAPAPSGSTSTTGAQSGPCTDEGEWYCSTDGSSFQRCASGSWSVAIPMAAGTTCTPGLSDSLNMTAAKSKRFGKSVVRRAHRLEAAFNA